MSLVLKVKRHPASLKKNSACQLKSTNSPFSEVNTVKAPRLRSASLKQTRHCTSNGTSEQHVFFNLAFIDFCIKQLQRTHIIKQTGGLN